MRTGDAHTRAPAAAAAAAASAAATGAIKISPRPRGRDCSQQSTRALIIRRRRRRRWRKSEFSQPAGAYVKQNEKFSDSTLALPRVWPPWRATSAQTRNKCPRKRCCHQRTMEPATTSSRCSLARADPARSAEPAGNGGFFSRRGDASISPAAIVVFATHGAVWGSSSGFSPQYPYDQGLQRT